MFEFFGFRRKANVDEAEQFIVQTIQQSIRDAVGDAANSITLSRDLTSIQQELSALKIDKARIEEEFAKREREIEHKVGLERKRQEFELGAAKREALVTVREENLKADRSRFEEQMKFQNDRFTNEVTYLKDMMGQMLERLPSAQMMVSSLPAPQEINITHKKGR